MSPIPTPRASRNHDPRVLNALLRCRRVDNKLASLFERIAEVPGLWVLELGPFAENSWPGWVAEVEQTLALHEPLLRGLGEGSTEYALHVSVDFGPGLRAVTMPPSLLQLLASCGRHREEKPEQGLDLLRCSAIVIVKNLP